MQEREVVEVCLFCRVQLHPMISRPRQAHEIMVANLITAVSACFLLIRHDSQSIALKSLCVEVASAEYNFDSHHSQRRGCSCDRHGPIDSFQPCMRGHPGRRLWLSSPEHVQGNVCAGRAVRV